MAFSINGVEMPTPSDMSIGIMDLSKAERNTKGTLIMERIATKRKLEVSYAYLNKDELSRVLNAVSSVFFSVRYTDPQTNSTRTGTFYCGDRNVGLIDYRNGVPRYKDVSFDLVER